MGFRFSLSEKIPFRPRRCVNIFILFLPHSSGIYPRARGLLRRVEVAVTAEGGSVLESVATRVYGAFIYTRIHTRRLLILYLLLPHVLLPVRVSAPSENPMRL